ncbi:GH25 family lysozyme [Sphingomonas sp. CJ99]
MAKSRLRPATWALFLMLGAVVAGAALIWTAAARWRPASDQFPIQGVAVDASNGPVDWFAARTDAVDFAYVLATTGAGMRDPLFEQHWQQLFDASIRRGAIHRFSPCQAVDEQARLFISTVPRTADALPAILHIDRDPACPQAMARQDLLMSVRTFLSLSERHLGKPMLLSITAEAEDEWQVSAAIERPVMATRRLFIPDYLARPWRIWQASDTRRIAGAKGTVRWLAVAP